MQCAVEAWIKPNSIGAYQYVVSRETYGVAGTGGGYELTLNNLGKLRFDVYHSYNSYTPVIGSTVLTTGQWNHVRVGVDLYKITNHDSNDFH